MEAVPERACQAQFFRARQQLVPKLLIDGEFAEQTVDIHDLAHAQREIAVVEAVQASM